MNKMKRDWGAPRTEIQRFAPQEFVAACAQPTQWVAKCDDYSSLIFYGTPAGPYDLVCDLNRGGCGQTHVFELENGLKPEANCWILQGVSANTKYSDNNLADFAYMFENISTPYSQYDGHVSGLQLKKEYSSKLIPAYVNEDVVDGVLLTSDIGNIKNPS